MLCQFYYTMKIGPPEWENSQLPEKINPYIKEHQDDDFSIRNNSNEFSSFSQLIRNRATYFRFCRK